VSVALEIARSEGQGIGANIDARPDEAR